MSVELLLLPVAVAAVSAWQAKRTADEAGREIVAVNTRMRDESLLQLALTDTNATVVRHAGALTAAWGDTQGRFTCSSDGIWSAHFIGDTNPEHATALVNAIDSAYGRRVQQAVLSRLRERIPEAGMSIRSETTEDDHSVTLVLNVHAGGTP
jgi:hypothetical protein